MHAPARRRLPHALAALLLLAAGLLAAAAPAAAEPRADAPAAAAPGDQWLTGYWHNFDNGSTTLPISEVPTAYNLIAVAFADNLAGTPGGITFNLAGAELGGYTEQEFKDDIAAAQAQGRKVVISVGGERGHVNVTNATEAANFANTTYALMREYGFDGVDIDLEHGMNAQYMEQALRSLRSQAGADLIITMAPQTIDFQAPTYAYHQLARGIADILTIVNMQYYNSGSMMGCDQQVYSQGTVDFLTAQACIQLELNLRPDQVGLGLPAVPSAAGGGHQSTANVIRALDCLESGVNCGAFRPAEPYGPIGGVMTWSINWDATNGYRFAADIGARLATGSPDPGDPDPGDPDPGNPGDCTDPAWSATAVYTGGARVSYNGAVYEARHWTQGDTPVHSAWGPWREIGPC
ncbi:glycosyl hydrolase family 18 protein [Nocardiopsis trehalosi]|uniref:glycosyl hydrolase family 18 protein n=1 Tax=Nocardiopsis trehalosi TaxID=109329 RepID=UPI000A00B5D0|nr:glycosyl hydrolase family 18 protein [Nocardiopsis trehalosi]